MLGVRSVLALASVAVAAAGGCGRIEYDPHVTDAARGLDAAELDAAGLDAAGLDAGTPSDAGSFDAGSFDAGSFDAGPAPPPTCGRASALQDGFEGTTFAPWWELSTPAPFLDGGVVEMLPPTAPETGAAELAALPAIDLRENAITVEVREMVSTSSTAEAYLRAYYDDDNYLEMLQVGGMLRSVVRHRGLDTTRFTPWTPSLHRFWRIRESGGRVFLETSRTDAGPWTMELGSSAGFTAYVRPQLGARTPTPETGPGGAAFDRLTDLVPRDPWCPADSFRDDFASPTLEAGWEQGTWFGVPAGGPCIAHEAAEGGRLRLDFDDGTPICALTRRPAYDLRDRSVTVEIAPSPTLSELALTWLLVSDLAGDVAVAIGTFDGMLTRIDPSGGMTTLEPYGGETFWRLRSVGTTVHFEVSADGSSYRDVASASVGGSTLELSATRITFLVGSKGGRGTAYLRTFNP
jgi:hypothetical protein